MEDNTLNELTEILNFVGHKKKKKSKFIKEDIFGSMEEDANDENRDISLVNIPEEEVPKESVLDSDQDLNFDLRKKKKKKKMNMDDLPAKEHNEIVHSEKVEDCSVFQEDTDRDYEYDFILQRVFDIMRAKNPDREEGKKKLVMKPPQVIRVGTKKTSFINFLEICKMLHRTPQHLQNFLLVELGTTGSVDGNNQLIVKGRFEQRQLETVLRRYIKEYVTCHTCRSPDTLLQRDTRLCFLQCESCGSRCSVASVKSGFQALTGKRAAMRAKAVV